MKKIGILGASGYGGGELIRWLSSHPEARPSVLVSSTYAGKRASASFPGLAKRSDIVLTADENAVESCDFVFLASADESAMRLAPELLAAGKKLVDLSPTFRYRDAAEYQNWYAAKHCAGDLTQKAVYGLPELRREQIRDANLIGNPGCYATAAILALSPLLKQGLLETSSLILDGKSGVSGAGRSKFGLGTHFSEINESCAPYKVGGTHRHTGEIEQELSAASGASVRVSFTPHLVPMTRGVLISAYAKLAPGATYAQAKDAVEGAYAQEPFVAVVEEPPATKHVFGSNMAHLSLAFDDRTNTLSVFAAIDNLGKGMAGQAVQNMNLMLGFSETAGLEGAPLWP